MFYTKYLRKTFTSKLKSSPINQGMDKYKLLLEKSSYITEELFPKKMNSSQELRNYLHIEQISQSTSIKGKEQLDSINESIFRPGWDMLKRKGKKWRPILGLMIAHYFKLPIEDINSTKLLYQFLTITELLHNASLIVDDVEDKSLQRRNEPCVHLKFGESIAINAGIIMFYLPIFRVIKEIKDVNTRAKLSEIYFEEMTAIHVGQGWDIEMKVDNRLPSIDDYRDTVLFKTGVCPRLIVKMIKILLEDTAENNEAIKEFLDVVDHISIGFQIKDDLLNISKSNLAKGKGFLGEDIFEGKMTLMVLHTLNSNDPLSRKERLKEILLMKTMDEKLIDEAIDIMSKNRSIDFASDIMNHHITIAEEKCQLLAKNKSFNTDAVNDVIELVEYLIELK